MSLIETDSLSNQNISSRLEIASFTAGQYYKQVQAHIFLDQLAGNGDYVIDITHQRAGAGTAYRTVNVTQAVESGVTNLKSVTLPFPVNNTDVVKVYVTGLAGDTTTPDTVVEWHDVSSLTAEEMRAALGLASANLDTQLDALPTAAEINAEVVDVLTVDTLADSYASDGSQPTLAQAVLAIQQFLMEKSMSGTTVTVKKPDGSTTAMTFTTDNATSPSSITRAT